MTPLFDFLFTPLTYAFMQRGLAASVMVGILCAVMGTYVVLRGMAFLGDAIAHAILPGIAVAYLLNGSLFLGAGIAAGAVALGIGFFEAAAKGAEEAAKELGDVEIIYTGPTDTTAEGQIEVINALIAQGVNAIAISANDRDALVPALKKAMDRGITLSDLRAIYAILSTKYPVAVPVTPQNEWANYSSTGASANTIDINDFWQCYWVSTGKLAKKYFGD